MKIDISTGAPAFNSQNPATWLKPDEPLIGADGRDWSWCYVWHKDAVGFPEYKVGVDGTVWSRKIPGSRGEWRKRKLGTLPKGYRTVSFRGGDVGRYAHQLVLEAFVGPCPDGMECRHLDGNPTNNRIDNLAWGTPIENAADQSRHGTKPRGSRSAAAKLDDDQVAQIVACEGLMTHNEIADRFGITRAAVGHILRGETWSEFTGRRREPGVSLIRIGERHPTAKLNEQDVREIIRLRATGMTFKAIGDRFGIGAPSAYNICKGKLYARVDRSNIT